MSDEAVHYMESTSRLRERNAELDAMLKASEEHTQHWEAEASRLRAESKELRERQRGPRCERCGNSWAARNQDERELIERVEAAEATMREVAETLRVSARSTGGKWMLQPNELLILADRLDPPTEGARDE